MIAAPCDYSEPYGTALLWARKCFWQHFADQTLLAPSDPLSLSITLREAVGVDCIPWLPDHSGFWSVFRFVRARGCGLGCMYPGLPPMERWGKNVLLTQAHNSTKRHCPIVTAKALFRSWQWLPAFPGSWGSDNSHAFYSLGGTPFCVGSLTVTHVFVSCPFIKLSLSCAMILIFKYICIYI